MAPKAKKKTKTPASAEDKKERAKQLRAQSAEHANNMQRLRCPSTLAAFVGSVSCGVGSIYICV